MKQQVLGSTVSKTFKIMVMIWSCIPIFLLALMYFLFNSPLVAFLAGGIMFSLIPIVNWCYKLNVYAVEMINNEVWLKRKSEAVKVTYDSFISLEPHLLSMGYRSYVLRHGSNKHIIHLDKLGTYSTHFDSYSVQLKFRDLLKTTTENSSTSKHRESKK